MSELRSCPFCGAIPQQPACYRGDAETMPKWGFVECGCGARSGDVRTEYRPIQEWADNAAAEWNTRAGEASDDEIDKAIWVITGGSSR